MISAVRGLVALSALGAALVGCGADSAPVPGHARRPAVAVSATAASQSPAPARPSMVAPGPAGMTRVFESGPRTGDKAPAASVPTAPGAVESSGTAASRRADPDSVLADALADLADDAHGHFSVAVADLDSRTKAVYAPDDHRFATASIVKVDILAALLLQAQREGRSLRAEEKTYAAPMIRVSENAPGSRLWSRIGGPDGLADAHERLGLTATTPGPQGLWGLTRTTAADQLRLLDAITSSDSPLSSASRAYLQDLMTHVRPGQDWGVTAARKPGPCASESATGPVAALKNGWLPRSATGLWVVNTIGVVEHDGHRLLIAVLSDDQPSLAAGMRLVEAAASKGAEALTAEEDQSRVTLGQRGQRGCGHGRQEYAGAKGTHGPRSAGLGRSWGARPAIGSRSPYFQGSHSGSQTTSIAQY